MLAAHFVRQQPSTVLHLHRDTRSEDLVAKATVVRRTPLPKGELVSRCAQVRGCEGDRTLQKHAKVRGVATSPGKLLEAELCVLDDVHNAPGEALSSVLGALTRQDSLEMP